MGRRLGLQHRQRFFHNVHFAAKLSQQALDGLLQLPDFFRISYSRVLL